MERGASHLQRRSAPMSAPRRPRPWPRRMSPRTTHRQERRQQRRKLATLARRIMARHYPDTSQECPF
jgi:hypothetical protein